MDVICSLMSPKHWRQRIADKHMDARFIPINKNYPNIPEFNQYRPIVVASPVVKMLEGIIVDKLK